jgi:hypothetical protein
LFEMVVTADLSHQLQERSGFDEDRKAIADDREWRGNAKPREKQHRHSHRDPGDESCEYAGGERFRFAHWLSILLGLRRYAQECGDDSRASDERAPECARNF